MFTKKYFCAYSKLSDSTLSLNSFSSLTHVRESEGIDRPSGID